MSKKLIIALSLSLLLVLVFWRLKTLTYGGDSPVEVATVCGPLQFIMTVSKTRFNLGEPVGITLTIRNISNETILLGFTLPCKVNFLVYNRFSQIFNYFCSRVWADTGSSLVLNPNKTFSQTLQWEQVAIDDSPPYAVRQVRHGIYYIRGQIGPYLYYIGSPDEHDPPNFTEFITIETSIIELYIL